MKLSYIKYKNDDVTFKIPQKLGMPVFEIEEPEQIDEQIKILKNEKYNTIIIPNDLASFSEDIIKKYKNDTSLNIFIVPKKNLN